MNYRQSETGMRIHMQSCNAEKMRAQSLLRFISIVCVCVYGSRCDLFVCARLLGRFDVDSV